MRPDASADRSQPPPPPPEALDDPEVVVETPVAAVVELDADDDVALP